MKLVKIVKSFHNCTIVTNYLHFPGLDPADPYFSDTESIVRLDPSDATFVDIVHTDAAPFVKGGKIPKWTKNALFLNYTFQLTVNCTFQLTVVTSKDKFKKVT